MLTPEQYEAKRAAKYARFLELAEKAERESQSAWNSAHQMADVIPFGQPILIGHHSEGRDRRYRARIEAKHRKGYELHQKAAYYADRAQSTQYNNAIFSDDPQASEKIEDKITHLEELQETYKAVNAAYRKFLKDPASLDAADLPAEYKVIIRDFKPEWSGDSPIPAYCLQNNGANIRRLKERAQTVTKRQAQEDSTLKIGNITIEASPSENRFRIYFPGKPDEATRTALKQHGFRWAPSQGCWSAYYNANARWFIETLKKA
jgi:hypothetical protein